MKVWHLWTKGLLMRGLLLYCQAPRGVPPCQCECLWQLLKAPIAQAWVHQDTHRPGLRTHCCVGAQVGTLLQLTAPLLLPTAAPLLYCQQQTDCC